MESAARPEDVSLDIDASGVAHVVLERPQRMNALDGAMFDAILGVTEHLSALPADRLRAVVLSGAGRAFCAGLDTAQFSRLLQGDAAGLDVGQRSGGQVDSLEIRTHGIANGPQQVVLAWRQLPVPVIAAVHGPVFGGGLQLALGADLRMAGRDARLSVMEMRWGLVPDMGGMLLLRELLGADRVRELVYTARELTADEACALGLVSRVCDDPLAEARALAAEIARQSPQAVRAAKRLLNAAFDGASPAELLLAEAREQQAILGSAEQIETVRARLERRAPNYRLG